jgi:hypothetical protein
MTVIETPKVLGPAGRKFWREVTRKYELRVDELRTLESACVALDLVAELDKEWTEDGRPKTSTGSMGQKVPHPLFTMILAARTKYEDFVKRLALPDDEAGEGEAGKPNQHRSAAQTKWAAAHGRS